MGGTVVDDDESLDNVESVLVGLALLTDGVLVLAAAAEELITVLFDSNCDWLLGRFRIRMGLLDIIKLILEEGWLSSSVTGGASWNQTNSIIDIRGVNERVNGSQETSLEEHAGRSSSSGSRFLLVAWPVPSSLVVPDVYRIHPYRRTLPNHRWDCPSVSSLYRP